VRVELDTAAPAVVACDLLAVPFTGRAPSAFRGVANDARERLDALAAGASAEPGSISLFTPLPGDGVAAARVALVGTGAGAAADVEAVRLAAAAAVRSAASHGGTVAWAYDRRMKLDPASQVRGVVEGALLAGYDAARWKTTARKPAVDRLVVAGAPRRLAAVAERAETLARWTNQARDLVDAPPNEMTPAGLADAAHALLEPLQVGVETLDLPAIEELGMGGLAAVGRGSGNEPRLIVARTGPGAPDLALVGKGVTFDSGGYFLKGQGDIVKMKADMAGGAAVLAAVGAIAELGLPLTVLGVVPAAENAIDGSAFRPGDILRTASGLTVEITNPDAEGRLLLADGIWFALREGASRVIDVATLTGATRGALGDRYIAVFANEDAWRQRLVDAGEAAGDWAWPMPLHQGYHRLLDSRLADLRNTSGRSFGYAIIAAAFIERFAGSSTWAHLDIHSSAYLDEERDYFSPGATGAGVRLLVELASGVAAESSSAVKPNRGEVGRRVGRQRRRP